MKSNFKVKIDPPEKDVCSILANVWGTNSTLSAIPKYGSNDGECTAIGVFDNEKIVACGILKYLNNTTVELGGIAVLNEYRSRGISKLTYKKRAEILVSKNFKIISYGTVGSTVLYKLTDNINTLSKYPAFCANITPFIVPVSAVKCKQNISNPVYYKNEGKTAYISTIEFIGMNSGAVTHSIRGIEKLMDDFNISCEHVASKHTEKSFDFNVPKTKLRIISLDSQNQLNKKTFVNDEIIQLRVSNMNYSDKVIADYRHLGFLFSGITIDNDNVLSLCFVKGISLTGFNRILQNLVSSDYPENIKIFANHIYKINN